MHYKFPSDVFWFTNSAITSPPPRYKITQLKGLTSRILVPLCDQQKKKIFNMWRNKTSNQYEMCDLTLG